MSNQSVGNNSESAVRSQPLFDNAVTLCLLLGPLLQTYGWQSMNFATIFTLLLLPFYVFYYGLRPNLPRLLLAYFIYWLIAHTVWSRSLGAVIHLGAVRLLLFYLMYYNCIHLDDLLRQYKAIGIVCIVFLLYQSATYELFGYRVSGVLKFLPLNIHTLDKEYYYELVELRSRSASFFSEPSHFCQYMMPLLCLELFYDKKLNRWLYVFLIVVSVLLSQSGNGILGLAVVAMFYTIHTIFDRHKPLILRFLFIFTLTTIVPLGITWYMQTEQGQDLWERRIELVSTDGNIGDGTHAGISGFLRIFRGYYVYGDYSTLEKVIGHDNNDAIRSHFRSSHMDMFMEDENDLYFNNIQEILVRTGIIGLLIFLSFLISEFRQAELSGKAILLTYLALSFIAPFYFSYMGALYLLSAHGHPSSHGDNENSHPDSCILS